VRNETTISVKALVIGGGIGGLASAIALRRAGFEVEVFERAPELREVGAGISLWANALSALDRLGLGDAIRQLGTPDLSAGLRSWNGRLLTHVSNADPLHKFGELCMVMHRAELQTALIEALGREQLFLDTSCTGFRQDQNGVVASFSNGRSARGDLLIGADGLNSTVRAQLHGSTKPTYAGYSALRAGVRFD